MDQYLLDKLSTELKIAPLNILREEAEMLLLASLAKHTISQDIIFYGGTALRLAYNCPRFSEDLDFLVAGKVKEADLKAAVTEAIKLDPALTLMDLKDKRFTLFALIRMRSPFIKHPLSIKIEISRRKNGIKKEFRPLSSPCSALQPTLFVATLDSLELTKRRAITDRDNARDWYDLWYLAALQRKPVSFPKKFDLDQAEFKREMRRFLPKDKWPTLDEVIKAAQ